MKRPISSLLCLVLLALASCSQSDSGGSNGDDSAAGMSGGEGGTTDTGGTAGTPPIDVGGTAGSGGTGGVGGVGGMPSTTCVLNEIEAVAPVVLPTPVGPTSMGHAGILDGVTSWTPPTTPGGLVPQQSWYSVGSTPLGDIYFSTADHVTNSALYKIDIATDTCSYAGDARAASEALNNWNAGESAQKFHIRPLYYQGRLYVATTDFSDPNAGYLDHRGFHWYAYDEAQAAFLDLSASEPGGVAAEHFQCMAMTLDSASGTLYCLGTPNGNLYAYKIAEGVTYDLGRPAEVTEQFVTVGRFMWVDASGVVYFTYSGYDSVFSYDPNAAFAAKTDWNLGGLELKFGQWSLDHKRCYLGDYEGRLYLFDDEANTFALIGQATVAAEYNSTEALYVWQTRLFQISADERKFYFMNDSSTGAYALFEYDLSAQMTTKIAELSELETGLPGPYLFHSAYDSWDSKGRFVYVNFNMVASNPMLVTRIDPVRVKVARGLLPELVEVSVEQTVGDVTVTRSGSATAALDVLLAIGLDDAEHSKRYLKATIPAGSSSLDVTSGVKELAQVAAGVTFGLAVVSNGNTYVAGTSAELRFESECE